MDIAEIKERKKDLESHILSKLIAFEEETGVQISSFGGSRSYADGQYSELVGFSLEVTIS